MEDKASKIYIYKKHLLSLPTPHNIPNAFRIFSHSMTSRSGKVLIVFYILERSANSGKNDCPSPFIIKYSRSGTSIILKWVRRTYRYEGGHTGHKWIRMLLNILHPAVWCSQGPRLLSKSHMGWIIFREDEFRMAFTHDVTQSEGSWCRMLEDDSVSIDDSVGSDGLNSSPLSP